MLIASTILATGVSVGFPFLFKKIIAKKKLRTQQVVLIFLVYCIIVLVLTIGTRNYDDEYSHNLRLFQCYKGLANQISYQWRAYRFKYNSEQFAIISRGICNIILNTVLFLPFGYLVPILFPEKVDRYWKMLCIGFAFTLLIETLQLILHRGCFDLDDLFHNTIGSIIGYVLYRTVIIYYQKEKVSALS